RPHRLGRLLAELRTPGRRPDEVGEENRGGAGGPFGRPGGHRSAVYFVCTPRGKETREAGGDRDPVPCTSTPPGHDPQLLPWLPGDGRGRITERSRTAFAVRLSGAILGMGVVGLVEEIVRRVRDEGLRADVCRLGTAVQGRDASSGVQSLDE